MNKYKHIYHSFLLVVIFSFTLMGYAESSSIEIPKEQKYPIIPQPTSITYGEGIVVLNNVRIVGSDFPKEASKLEFFFKEEGITLDEQGTRIQFVNDTVGSENNPEAYKLDITEKVVITAPTAKGAFYAIQSLKQLFRKNGNHCFLPQVNITDWPAFKIRGFMHDNGRNFQSIALLKEQLEVLAFYKMNVFHWHLTENEGWRLESKKYPELQSDEATSRKLGKFYTQEEFKEIVAFCKERHITVIPEFDIPGHSKAFRKAFGFKNMQEKEVVTVLLELFDELCELANEDVMPYIHLGTDEVRHKEERLPKESLKKIIDRVQEQKRKVIVWRPGMEVMEDESTITQLWSEYGFPRKGYPFIDSRNNYLNHLDPFSGIARLFFQQPCRQPKGDSIALGGIMCAWPDNRIDDERDVLRQNPIYSGIVFYSDAIWRGRKKNLYDNWAKLPAIDSPEIQEFRKFEQKVIAHRNRYFKGKEFPYVAQSDIQWKLIGPFDHGGDVNKSFAVEERIQESYMVNGEKFKWTGPHVGGTIHFKHFFGFPSHTNKKSGTYYAYSEVFSPKDRVADFWIGFHSWSRAGGRRGGPSPSLGQWHTTNPKIWVNGQEIAPPIWKQPSLAKNTGEIPFIDEDYFYREPSKIALKKGWNQFLLKIPHGGTSWKWMFTCVPVKVDGVNVREDDELKFDAKMKLE